MFSIKINVEKEIIIDKPISEIRNYLTNSKLTNLWSPWYVLEPNAKYEHSSQEITVWYKNSWNWDFIWKWVQICKQLQKNKLIDYDIFFEKPFKSKSESSFFLEDYDKKTKITWKMRSNMPFFLFFLKSSMEMFIWMDFDRWLKMLKSLVENWNIFTKSEVNSQMDFPEIYYIGIRNIASTQSIGEQMKSDYTTLYDFAKQNNINLTQPPLSIYNKVDFKTDKYDYTAIFPISIDQFNSILIKDNIIKDKILSSKVFKFTHYWNYEFLWNTWTLAFIYFRTKKIKITSSCMWYEKYLNDPQITKENDLITEIYIPIK